MRSDRAGLPGLVLAAAIDALEGSVLVLDREGEVEWANWYFLHRTGLALDRVVGKKIWRLAVSKDGGRFLESRWRAVVAGTRWGGRLGFPARDGTLDVSDYGLAPIRIGGEVAHVVAASRPRGVARQRELAGEGGQESEAERRVEELVAKVAHVARGVSITTGTAFFDSLVSQLARTAEADLAIVGRLAPEGGGRLRTLAVSRGGRPAANFDVALAGTPYANVASQGVCVFASRVQQLFPLDGLLKEMAAESFVGTPLIDSQGTTLGIIAALSSRPLADAQLVRSLLEIFATRASAELERMQSDAAFAVSESRYRAYIDASPVGVILVGDGDRITDANAAACRMFELERAELVGRRMQELLLPESGAAARRLLSSMREAGRASGEIEAETASGRRWWHVDSVRLDEGYGLAFLLDLSERRALEAQVRRSHKMEAIGRLAGGLAHDFNNLLTVIGGHATLLSRTIEGADESASHLDEIGKAVDRAARLSHQLLAFSRKQAAQPRPISLNEVIGELEGMLRRLIGEDVTLVTELAPEEGSVLADEGQLQQVLMNLAVNAREAMPSGGRLVISTASVSLAEAETVPTGEIPPGEYGLLRVADTGVGMDEDVLAHVFEPFFTTKTQGAGSGLGLATVYGIVRQSEGAIRIESAPGSGTTVHIYLPVRAGAPAGDAAARPRGQLEGRERVLLVEDQVGVRDLARRVLEGYGYSVCVAGSGEEALLRASERGATAPDALVADLVLPGMSGTELAERLAASHPGVGVLFITGYMEDFVGRHGRLPEGARLLQKPFAPTELVAALRDLLDGKAGTPVAAT
jgi:PAS domain S-box-containing protein